MFQWRGISGIINNIWYGTEKTYITHRIAQLTGKKFNIDDSLNISTDINYMGRKK